MTRAISLTLLALTLYADTPTPLEYQGKPLRLTASCAAASLRDRGLDCSPDEPCPVFLELVSLATPGSRLVVAGNLHTASATLTSLLLVSSDGGRTWTEAHARIPSAGLDHLQFADPDTGWASGQLLLSPPRDPFLLLTTDGGTTWRRRSIFGDTRLGTIEAFRFDSKTQGSLLFNRGRSGEAGGRYELYESPTGGDSWILRQATGQPPPLQATPPPAGWRIRVDGPLKAYVLERLQAARWTPVVSFLVAAGECRGE